MDALTYLKAMYPACKLVMEKSLQWDKVMIQELQTSSALIHLNCFFYFHMLRSISIKLGQ